MKALSYLQIIYRDYLVKRLGFKNDVFLSKHLQYLELAAPRFRSVAGKEKIWNENKFEPLNPDPDRDYIEYKNKFYPTEFTIIDLLDIELKIKKNNKYQLRKKSKYISATDISNYTYCPISYAIAQTFVLEKFESADVGIFQHEKNRLINYVRPFKFETLSARELLIGEKIETATEKVLSFNAYLNDNNKLFFDDISNSSVFFFGHDDNKKRRQVFKSNKGDFIGQPDYIFKKNIGGDLYVVEEKFQFIPKDPNDFNERESTSSQNKEINKKRNSRVFHENHKNQLRSYLFGISNPELKYGYLIYWKYELEYEAPVIVSCNVLKIEKNDSERDKLISIYTELKSIIKNKGGDFDIETRNASKCAGCINNILCGHKTGQFNKFTLPYLEKYLEVKYAEFPEELKR